MWEEMANIGYDNAKHLYKTRVNQHQIEYSIFFFFFYSHLNIMENTMSHYCQNKSLWLSITSVLISSWSFDNAATSVGFGRFVCHILIGVGDLSGHL